MSRESNLGDMAEAMHQMTELVKVATDAADGIRTDLAARGYSDAAQEQVAVEYIQGFVRMAMRVQQ